MSRYLGLIVSVAVLHATLANCVAAGSADRQWATISVDPPEVRIHGNWNRSALLVTGRQSDDRLFDLTNRAVYRVESPQIVTVTDKGVVHPLADGHTRIDIEVDGTRIDVPVVIVGMHEPRRFHFETDIEPILSRFGCNSSGRHGKAEGQNGFRLSVFASDPLEDFDRLTREGRGRRLFLRGGLSTIDTIDLKPEAPAEIRGDFSPIETNVPGTMVCEHLSKTARQMDKFSLVRSFSHFDANHGTADHYVLTGYPVRAGFNTNLKPNNQHPAHGATISRQCGPRGSVPPYVCLPRLHASAGSAFLGPGAAPFVVNADPNAPNFSVPDLLPPLTIDAQRLQSHTYLRQQVDRFQQSAEVRANRSARALTAFQEKAFDLMTSSATRAAFEIDREPEALRDEYGRTSLGQCCLMARRLVESGVRCVTIDHTNWDTHYAQFPVLKNDLLPQLDGAVPALFRDLSDRECSTRRWCW